ncbi:MAG: hypothetical protein ACREJQ_08690, partial [bacterium]
MAIHVHADPGRPDWHFIDLSGTANWTDGGNILWLVDYEVAVLLNDDASMPCERGPTTSNSEPSGVKAIEFHLPRPAEPGDFIVVYWGDQRSTTSRTFKTPPCPLGGTVKTPVTAEPAPA